MRSASTTIHTLVGLKNRTNTDIDTVYLLVGPLFKRQTDRSIDYASANADFKHNGRR